MFFLKLLIDGKDIDTGEYEYYPFADVLIKNPEKTFATLSEIKNGKCLENEKDVVFAKYCIGNEFLNERAIASAAVATQSFRKISLMRRYRMLLAVHARLLAFEDQLLRILIAEGHPEKLAKWEIFGMKRGLSAESLGFFKKEMRKKISTSEKETVYWIRRADGVVCVEPPRNAPCSNSFIAVLALLPGNSLIIKPPLRQAVSTIFLWREIIYPALIEYGAPAGIVNIVVGNSKRILDGWLNSPLVNDVLFFGDSEKGEKIGNKIYQSGKKPILELSGNDYLAVWKDADIDGAVDALCDAFLGSSQICMVPKAGLIHADIFEEFKTKLISKLPHIKAGLPSDESTSLTPLYRLDEFHAFLRNALDNGAKLLYGGEQINFKNESDQKGVFVSPALLEISDSEAAYRMRCVREENFFPLLPIVKVDAEDSVTARDQSIFDQMVNLVNSDNYGLRFSLWIRSNKYTRKFVASVENSGLFIINARHVGFPALLATHGGTKKSGGPHGELNYIWQKTSHLQGISRCKASV